MGRPASNFLVSAAGVWKSEVSGTYYIDVWGTGPRLLGFLRVANRDDGEEIAKRLVGDKCRTERCGEASVYYPPDAEKPIA